MLDWAIIFGINNISCAPGLKMNARQISDGCALFY